MLPYYLIFFLLLLLALAEQLFKKLPFIFGAFIVFCLILLSGLRGDDVSRDYTNYTVMFDETGSIKSYFINYGTNLFFEPLFYITVSLFKSIFGEFYFPIFLFFACFGIALKATGIFKFSPYPYLSLLLYFPSIFFLHDMTQIRIGLAGGIFLFLALPSLLKNNQRGKYIFYCLLATLFHYSCLLYLGLLFVNRISFNKKKYLLLLVFCLLISILRIDFTHIIARMPFGAISMKMDMYNSILEFTEEVKVNIFNVLFVLKLIFGLMLLFVTKRFDDNNTILFVKMYFISLCTFLFFSGTAMLAFRVSEVFGLIEFIVLVYLLKSFRLRVIPFGLLVMFACGYFFMALYITKYIQDYHTILW